MDNVNEIAIEWTKGADRATVTAYSNSKLKGKIKRLAEQFPEDVEIVAENKDGSICAHVPINYIRVGKPRTRKLSEEERQNLVERLKKGREKEE